MPSSYGPNWEADGCLPRRTHCTFSDSFYYFPFTILKSSR